MSKRISDYRRLELWATVIYISTSIVSVLWVLLILTQVSEFLHQELVVAIYCLLLILPTVAVLQFVLNRREMSPLKRWHYSENSTDDDLAHAVTTLLVFPMRIARITAMIWAISIISFSVLELLFADMPAIRIAQVVLSISSAGLISYVFQYNLLRLLARRMLDRTAEFRVHAPSADLSFGSVRPKYINLYGALLASCLLGGSILSYSIARSILVQNTLDETATVMALARDAKQDHPLDYEKIWRNIERGIGVRISLQENSEGAVPLKMFYDRPQYFLGFMPYFSVDRQNLPLSLIVSESLAGNSEIVIERNTEFLQAQMTRYLLQVTAVYLAVFLMGWGLLVVFVTDFFRPISQLRIFFAANNIDTLPTPLVQYSDDEAGLLNVQTSWMMRNMNHAVRDLKDRFWQIRDGKRNIRSTIAGQQQEIRETVKDNTKFYRSMEHVRQRMEPINQEMQDLVQVGGTVNTTLLKINETLSTVASHSDELQEAMTGLGATLDRYNSATGENNVLAANAYKSYLNAYEGIRQLEDLANTLYDSAEKLVENEKLNSENLERRANAVAAISSQVARIDKIFQAAATEARNLFGWFRTIREAVAQLEEVKEQTDILGFQTTIVSSQSPAFQREFSVVADEMKDLAERTSSASGSALKTIHSIHVGADVVMEEIGSLDDGLRQIEEFVRLSQRLVDRAGESQAKWEQEIVHVKDGLRFIDSDIEGAVNVLEENRQRIGKIQNGFSEESQLAVRAMDILQELSGEVAQVSKQIDQQQREFSVIGELMPRVQKILFDMNRAGSRVDDVGHHLEELIGHGEELVRNSSLHLDTITKVLDAADDVLDESEQKVRQISRFV